MCRTSANTPFALLALLAVAAGACSRSASPAETQQGAASDLNRPPQAGGAGARCADLP